MKALAALVLLTLSSLYACSGPHEGAVAFTTSSSSGGEEGENPPAGNNNNTNNNGGVQVNATFANEFLPKLTLCQSCHLSGANAAPIFFGEDAAKTYALFKQKGYDKATSMFITRGTDAAHIGGVLSAEQLNLYNKWIQSEGNPPYVPDAGTGGQ